MEIKPIASGSAGNCYYVYDGLTRLLIDCGIPFKKIQAALWGMGTGIPEVSGCLVSHCHGDHVKAAQKLADRGVDIYASQGTVDAAGLAGCNVHAAPRPDMRLACGTAWGTFKVGSFAVLPFDVEHDAPEPLGFIVRSNNTGEKLVYVTDALCMGVDVKGVTHLMIEANHDSQVMAQNVAAGQIDAARARRTAMNHMSIDATLTALERIDKSRLKEVWLLHLSNDNAGPDFKRRAQEACGCEVYVA